MEINRCRATRDDGLHRRPGVARKTWTVTGGLNRDRLQALI